jgi:hypothetical protein
MAMTDPATIFGVNVPDPDPEALAGAQNATLQLPGAAGRLRHLAQTAANPQVGQAVGQVADVAVAAASGKAPNV